GDKTDHEIIATHQPRRPGRAVFEESRALAGEQEAAFPRGEGVRGIARGPSRFPPLVYDSYGYFRQPCQGTSDHAGVFFAAFDKNFLGTIRCHFTPRFLTI